MALPGVLILDLGLILVTTVCVYVVDGLDVVCKGEYTPVWAWPINIHLGSVGTFCIQFTCWDTCLALVGRIY